MYNREWRDLIRPDFLTVHLSEPWEVIIFRNNFPVHKSVMLTTVIFADDVNDDAFAN